MYIFIYIYIERERKNKKHIWIALCTGFVITYAVGITHSRKL